MGITLIFTLSSPSAVTGTVDIVITVSTLSVTTLASKTLTVTGFQTIRKTNLATLNGIKTQIEALKTIITTTAKVSKTSQEIITEIGTIHITMQSLATYFSTSDITALLINGITASAITIIVLSSTNI